MTITHIVNVEHLHQANSYVRGSWRNSKKTSPMNLTESCHDMGNVSWLIVADRVQLSSFDSPRHFKVWNTTAAAPIRFIDGCPARDECPYYAWRYYLESLLPFEALLSLDDSEAAGYKALKKIKRKPSDV